MWIAKASKHENGPFEVVGCQELEEQIDDIVFEWEQQGYRVTKEEKSDEYMSF